MCWNECTHFEQAVAVDQQVPWFDVTVENPRRMQILQSCRDTQKKNYHQQLKLATSLAGVKKNKMKMMKIFTSQDLVEENFDVIRGEMLRRNDDLVQIALHQFRYDISTTTKKSG